MWSDSALIVYCAEETLLMSGYLMCFFTDYILNLWNHKCVNSFSVIHLCTSIDHWFGLLGPSSFLVQC